MYPFDFCRAGPENYIDMNLYVRSFVIDLSGSNYIDQIISSFTSITVQIRKILSLLSVYM
jgi:hypothetical protein